MSYVDLIIKYLSGDLSEEESRAFEKELESNAALKAAYEDQSAAYQFIRNQLQKRDLEAFETKLADAMGDAIPPHVPNFTPRRIWFLSPAIACLLAVFLIIFLGRPGNERVLSRYHHPEKDPFISNYYQETRGQTEPGITQYLLGNYAGAMDLLSVRISEDRGNKLIHLYYLLSAMELDRQTEALKLIGQEVADPQNVLDQSIRWYSSLALIKSDRREDALKMIQPLKDHAGPYQRKAVRVEKLLSK